MMPDRTEPQTDSQQARSRQLSLTRSRPPRELPGYDIRQFLGAGAYGEVWVAVDLNTGRRVAIKFYTHPGAVDWSLLSSEVEKLVFLSADRYVVQLLEVGWEAEPPYFVMEYMEHGSLEQLLEQRGPLPPAEAVALFREVAVGLLHAHGKGVLHCDVKPANVLLDQDRKPRLADFGQSRLSHEQTPALGTLFYMAPEQADLKAIPDAAWDVYALGALLYAMLTGVPPHRTEGAVAGLDSTVDLHQRLEHYRERIRTSPAPSAHRRAAGVDRALAEIINRCLAADPRRRYPNVQSVLDALRDRDLARQQRPLVLLGFVAPLLFLLIMGLFGGRGYRRAIGDSDRVLTQRAAESNRFAAKFVAEVVAREIDRYFRAVEQVARDRRFQAATAAVLDDPELAPLLGAADDPQIDPETAQQHRAAFVAHPHRQPLQQRIEDLLADPRRPRAASWFVTGPTGTHLASAFDSPPRQSPLGRNFGWRSYFHGGPADLTPDSRGPPAQAIRDTHLSAVFQSTATKTWKVAISTPVFQEERFLGVVALTVELGGFVKFAGTPRQFAVLVDGREGPNRGVILQHPLYDQMLQTRDALPARFSRYRVSLDQWRSEEVVRYQDPLREDQAGAAYAQDWIAARADVLLRPAAHDAGQEMSGRDTGLVVLAQESYREAAAPVHQLGRRLAREGLVALAVVVAVVIVLWYVVARSMREHHASAMATAASTSTPSSLHSMETIEPPRRVSRR